MTPAEGGGEERARKVLGEACAVRDRCRSDDAEARGNVRVFEERRKAYERDGAAAARQAASENSFDLDARAEDALAGRPVAPDLQDSTIEASDDLASAEARTRVLSEVSARVSARLAASEVALREAENAVRAAAAGVLRAQVEDRLDVLFRARQAVEESEIFVESVLRRTAAELRPYSDQFVGVNDRVKNFVPWRSRTFHPATDPLGVAERARVEDWNTLLAGDGEH